LDLKAQVRNLIEDLRYAFRLLRKSPVFTTVAVLTLALGIGANTAIYTLLDQALLRPLPVKDPNHLVLLRHTGSDPGYSRTSTFDDLFYSYPMYRDLRDRNAVFDGLIATYWPARVGVQWHKQSELAYAELVSGNYFDVLGVQPALGRLFVASDDVGQEAHPFIVLSFNCWQRQFGGDPRVLNQSISVNGHPFTVIGVAAPGFHSVVSQNNPALFVPMMMKPEITPGWNDLEERQSVWLNIIGRLKPGVSQTQAQAGLDPLWHSIRAEELKLRGHSSRRFQDTFLTNSQMFLIDGSKGVPWNNGTPTTLLVVMGMAVLMALMACTNVGSLLLVRVAARMREIAVRYALGSSRGRLIAQLFAEGALLGIAGGILGIAVASQVSRLLIHMVWAGSNESGFSSRPDVRILVFNFVLALLVSVLLSLAPAFQFWRPNAVDGLKQQSNAVTGGPLRLRRASVIAQIGVSLLLLAGAGLFVRTLHNLKSVDVGFSTDHLLTFSIDPRLAGYRPDQTAPLHQQILDRLASLPGVRSAAATTDAELRNQNNTGNVTVAGYQAAENEDMNVEHAEVSPFYVTTMKMALLAGREITDQDRTESQKVAVVNDSFAKRYFGNPQNAIGAYFCFGAGDVKPDVQIVGVVADSKHTSVRGDIHRGVLTPYLQDPQFDTLSSGMTFYVRTWQAPADAEATIRGAMGQLDSKLVLNDFRTMQEQVETNLSDERVIAFLATAFGLLAALMAAIGIYGVLAYSMAQRTREVGLRVALGATRVALVKMVLQDVLTLTSIGIAAAIPLSLVLAHAARAQLFGVSQFDPVTLVCVSMIVLAVAIAASAIPAYRATRVDPMVALRYE
jgi:putative ABC transport system permease protein